ncbi:carboxymuconolactone decarboxylase family protein (plasmid) [Mycobacterium sp. TJFP1]
MRSPGLFKTFLPLLSRLVAESELPAHDRQVLVLRTCELTGEVYEATHHVLISRASGLSGEQIEAAQTGIGLSPVHTLLAAAAQELVTDFSVSDTTWNGLAEHYSDIELMDIVALVAVYTFMATLTRGLGIQLEDDETIESFVALREYT